MDNADIKTKQNKKHLIKDHQIVSLLGHQYVLVWHWPHQSQYLDARNRLLD